MRCPTPSSRWPCSGSPPGRSPKPPAYARSQVEAARRVAAANQAVKQAIVEAPELTLDQAAELTSWGDDPDAVADLLAAAEDGAVSFAHTQARLAEAKERQAAITTAEDAWIAKGYLVLAPEGYSEKLPPGAAYVRDLAGADGTPLLKGWSGVSQGHATCPDRAVFVNRWRPEDANEVCLDPKKNNHPKAPTHQSSNAAAQQKAGQERATVIANNKSWKLATGVRETHLAGFIRAGKFSPGLVDALHRHLVAHPGHLEDPWHRQLFFTLLDFTGSGVAKGEGRNGLLKTTVDPTVPGNRVTGQLLAAVADAAERSLANSTWRHPNTGGTDYLTLLVAHTGYQLSDIEVTAMKATNPKWTPPRTTPPATRTAKAAVLATGPGHRDPGGHQARPPGRRPKAVGGPRRDPPVGEGRRAGVHRLRAHPGQRPARGPGPRASRGDHRPGSPRGPPTDGNSRSVTARATSPGPAARYAATDVAGTATRRGRYAHQHERSTR